MSKKIEKESKKKKENNQEIDKKEVGEEASDKTNSKGSFQAEDKSAELKKLEEEIAGLKKDRLLLAADLKNERANFQRQIEQIYKYSNKKLVS